MPKFRVKQLANHYYGHFDVNAEEFSDFPAARRSDAAEAFFPELIHEVTRQVADGGTTIKTLWRLFDGSLIDPVVQGGAFDSDSIANGEWQRLAGRNGGLFSGKSPVIQEHQSNGRTFWRLRVAGFDSLSEARQFCSALQSSGTDCLALGG